MANAFKVTATHKTQHVRIALAATADNAEEKASALRDAGYWENIEVAPAVFAMKSKRVAL